MYYNEEINKKIPGCYILVNSKEIMSYFTKFKEFKSIITNYNTLKLNILSISTDFEKSIIHTIKLIFPNVHHVGCLFHYIK